jgi:hypothetical protein
LLEPNRGTKTNFAGGHAHDVTGVDSVAIQLSTDEIQKVINVLYSLGITKNLLLVGFLAEKGFLLEFETHMYHIRDLTSKTIAITERSPENGL